LATWEEGNLKETTAEDDPELAPGRLRATADDSDYGFQELVRPSRTPSQLSRGL